MGSSGGRLALQLVGTLVGTAIGGPVGGAIGGAIGTVAGAAIFPSVVEGPRADEFRVTRSSYGQAIGQVFGASRTGGNIIQVGPVQEIVTETKVGLGSKTEDYSYSQTVAIAVSEGEIESVVRVWADRRLIYDNRTSNTGPVKPFGFNFRVYRGTEDQEPDPVLEALKGTGNVPAYRGVAYIVLQDFPITEFGNRIPTFEFEVIKDTGGADSFSRDNKFAWAVDYLEDQIRSVDRIFVDPFEPFTYVMNAETENGSKYIGKFNTFTGELVASGYVDLDGTGLKGQSSILDAFGPVTRAPGGRYIFLSYLDLGHPHVFVKIDKNTLGWVATSPGHGHQGVSIYTAVNFDETWVFGIEGGTDAGHINIWNTVTDEVYSSTYASLPGSAKPSSTPNCCVFDYLDQVWVGCEDGTLARYTLGGVGAITLNLFAEYDFTAYGQIDEITFVPSTRDLLLWMADGYMIRFNVDTAEQVGPAFPLHWTGNHINDAQDKRGWHDHAEFGVVWSASTDGFYVFNAETGDEVFYPLSDWGRPNFSSTWNGSYDYWTGVFWTPEINSLQLTRWLTPRFPVGATSLKTICEKVCAQTGMVEADYDFTAFAATAVRGYLLDHRLTARAALQGLQSAFFFDIIEADWKLKGSLRGGASVATIAGDYMGASDARDSRVDRIVNSRGADKEIPQYLDFTYYNQSDDYLRGSESAARIGGTQYSDNITTVQTAIVMTPDEAATAALRVLYSLWATRETVRFPTGPQYLKLTAGDPVTVPRGSENLAVRLTKQGIGANLIMQFEGVLEDASIYTLTKSGVGVSGFEPAPLDYPSPPEIALMDTALLRETDDKPGIYATVGPIIENGIWNGGSIEKSADGISFEKVGSVFTPPTWGASANKLGAPDKWTVFDRTNYLDVFLRNGTLTNASEDELVASRYLNLLYAGGELLQFATVTALTGGQYRLSDLLRGRFGTEQFVGTHQAGEDVVSINAGWMTSVEYAASELDALRYYRGRGGGTHPFSSVRQLTQTTRRLMPYAPYFIEASRAANDITINWLRRSRAAGFPLWDAPLFEASEAYEIDILDGSNVVRTLTATLSANGSGITSPSSQTAFYDAADQVTDFGSAQAAVDIVVYQLNTTRGRGYGAAVTV